MGTQPHGPFPKEPSRLLVRGVNWLGDAVMTTPALQRLRDRFPQAHIALLTPEHLADLWNNYSPIDRVVTFRPGESPRSVAGRLRSETFDTALLFPNSPRSALEVWLAGIPHRIGYSRPWRNWFLTQIIPARSGRVGMRKRTVSEIRRLVATQQPMQPGAVSGASSKGATHQIHEYLHLAGVLGADPAALPPKVAIAASEVDQARATWIADSRSAVLLGLNPSAAYGPAKRWPTQHFAAVAHQVSKQCPSALWVLFGAETDRQLCEEIGARARVRTINLAGKTSLRELMALLKLCRVVLTNDSGPMHLAAALGVPVVVPFGSTSPELTGPGLPGSPGHYLLRSSVPCSPCYRRVCPIDFRCMHSISVDQVVAAVLRAWDV